MKQPSPITFIDRDSGQNAVVIVRASRGAVGLGLSLEGDGDMEVFFGASELQALLRALETVSAQIADAQI